MGEAKDQKKLQEDLLKFFDHLDAEHKRWHVIWQECIDYVNRKNIVIGSGQRYNEKPRVTLYNDAAEKAARTCSDGIQGYVVPRSSPWFKVTTTSQKDNDIPGLREHQEHVEERLYAALNRSNFYTAFGEMVFDGGTIGTGIMYEDEDLETNRIRFSPRFIDEVRLGENVFGDVNVIFRTCKMTIAECSEFFGDDLPDQFERRLKGSPDEQVEVIHFVGPVSHPRYGQIKVNGQKPNASVYMIKEHDEPIRIHGYDTFPYQTWRWSKRTGDIYGWGPGCQSIATIKMLNLVARGMADSIQMASRPPMAIWGKANGLIDLSPKALNFLESMDSRIEKIDAVGNLPITKEFQDMLQQQIERAFLVDVFLMLDSRTRQMTAEEVSQLMGEKAAITTPIIGRLTSDVLQPMLHRVFDLELKAGRIEPLPDNVASKLTGTGYEIDFVGPLAQAQRRYHKTAGIKAAVQEGIGLLQVKPQIADNIDWDEAYRRLTVDSGLPPSLLLDKKAVAKSRQSQAQMAQQMQGLEAQKIQSETSKNLAVAPEPGSPLERLAQAQQAQQQAQQVAG